MSYNNSSRICSRCKYTYINKTDSNFFFMMKNEFLKNSDKTYRYDVQKPIIALNLDIVALSHKNSESVYRNIKGTNLSNLRLPYQL